MEAHTTPEVAPAERRKTETDIVGKVHGILQEKHAAIADKFLDMPYVKQAQGQPEHVQRVLVNRQLRMHLGQLDADTSIARLALDDTCAVGDYLKNFKRYTAPLL